MIVRICGECTYLCLTDSDYYGTFYCEKKSERHLATDPSCRRSCYAYKRSNSAINNAIDFSKSHSSSGCYLTTIMCKILNYPDNCYYLQMLRTFRDTVMKTNINYYPLLYTYDVIGPIIANKLEHDPNRIEIANVMFSKYIINAVTAIEESKEKEAINTYIAMTNALGEKYNIDTSIIMPNINELNINSLGHARKKIKET